MKLTKVPVKTTADYKLLAQMVHDAKGPIYIPKEELPYRPYLYKAVEDAGLGKIIIKSVSVVMQDGETREVWKLSVRPISI